MGGDPNDSPSFLQKEKNMKVTGLKVSDILAMTDQELSRKSITPSELQQILQRAVSVANKRLKRMEQSGISRSSQAYVGRAGEEDIAPRFSTASEVLGYDPKNATDKWHALKEEFNKVKSFLTAKTGTIAGTKETKKTLEEKLGGTFESDYEANKFFDAYNKIKEEHAPLFASKQTSDLIIAKLFSESVQKMKIPYKRKWHYVPKEGGGRKRQYEFVLDEKGNRIIDENRLLANMRRIYGKVERKILEGEGDGFQIDGSAFR